MERILVQSIGHDIHEFFEESHMVILEKLVRELGLAVDVFHDYQKSFQPDDLDFRLVMF